MSDAPWTSVTHCDFSDTNRRAGPVSGTLARAARPLAGQKRPPGGERERKSCSPLDTDGNLSRSNRDITTYLPFFTTIMRQSSRVNTAHVDTSDGERGA